MAGRENRQRAWQRMLSGRRLDLLDPDPDAIGLDDIARGLARVARWNGQTSGSHVFSVAQHSILVERIAAAFDGLNERERLVMLLHDAPEYVVGDIITPLKGVIGSPYAAVEARLLAAIHRRFGLVGAATGAVSSSLKAADRIAARLEAVALAGFDEAEADRFFGPPTELPDRLRTVLPDLLAPWPTALAETRFVEHAVLLGAG